MITPRKVMIVGGEGRVSLLERLARRVEPSKDQLELLRPKNAPLISRVARMIKQAVAIEGVQDLVSHVVDVEGKSIRVKNKNNRAPRPTSALVKMLDGKDYRFFDDGSLRHAAGRVRGKGARKRWKRANRLARELAARRAS